MGENICREELEDWKAAVIFVLRRWILLLLIIVCMAGIFVKMRIDKGPEFLYTEEEIDNMQQQLIRNESTIERDEGNIIVLQNTLAQQQQTMASYKKTYDELNRQLDLAAEDSVILDLSNRINSASSTIMNIQTQISSSEQSINAFSSEIISLESQNESYRDKLSRNQQTLGKRELAKSAVIGGIAGGFLGVIMLLLWYLFNGKLQQFAELERIYGYYLLGAVYESRKGAGLISHLLDVWEGHLPKTDVKKEYDLIAAHIEVLNDSKNWKIALTGTAAGEKIKAVAEQLEKYLPERYTVKTMPNPVYDAESLRHIREYALIVVEEKNVSQKKEIAKLTNLLLLGKAEVQGAIGV